MGELIGLGQPGTVGTLESGRALYDQFAEICITLPEAEKIIFGAVFENPHGFFQAIELVDPKDQRISQTQWCLMLPSSRTD